MLISMIAAMANNRIIGANNQMPWHLPADFAWFKKCTLGKPVIMGHQTYLSIGRPLPERINIVVSRNRSLRIANATVVHSIDEALAVVAEYDEVMVIGGGSIYQACITRASRLYLTFIDLAIDGDTTFPEWGAEWQEIYSETYQADSKNAHAMRFVILEK